MAVTRKSEQLKSTGQRQTAILQPLLKHPATPAVLWRLLLCLVALAIASPALVQAQTFQAVPALSFTKAYQGADPLSQVFTVASTGANFNYYATVVAGTGGNWLTLTGNTGCCATTPQAITVNANPGVTLAAGVYTAQIVVKSQSGAVSMTIPVTLNIKAAGSAFLDDLPGGLSFSMLTAGNAPPVQTFQVRNAGTGTLSWTVAKAYGDGGNWLSVSATSGTGTSTVAVTITPANLPGAGLTAGTYVALLTVQTAADSTTIPVTVTVGASVLGQINPLNFVKPFEGGDPLSQIIPVSSTGTSLNTYASVVNSTGGNWLTLTGNTGCCSSTPQALTVNVNPNITLATGVYSAEIIIKSQAGSQAVVVPVTLTILPPTVAFFADLPGELTFSLAPGGTAPPAQIFQIQNAGEGTLNWTLGATTSDGGSWITASAVSGTAPSSVAIGIVPAKLPGNGLISGTFAGQVILQGSQARVTIPITVTVGTAAFSQINALSFTKPYEGANPLPQVITISSTGTNFNAYIAVVNSTGGNWLTLAGNIGCCATTPQAVTVGVAPDITLAPGTYFAEIIAKSQSGSQSVVVPVSLTVQQPTEAFFDALPGQLSFSMLTGGTAPPTQAIQVRNAGAGSLAWTGSATTADGGKWLTLSSTSGVAPNYVSIGINPANLPGQGLVAGTFGGQVVLLTAGDEVTIPVTVTVGAAVFRQINPLVFTKTFEGANPLPQVITLASTGTNFNAYATVASSTGGSWLTLRGNTGCCSTTPQTFTVNASPDITLAAGSYMSEIVIKSQSGGESVVVPVTLIVVPQATPQFDALPSELTYSMAAGGLAPGAQALQIRNAGAGTLNWTLGANTSDGGSWITVSATSGTAPSAPTFSIKTANLPGKGLVAGTYTGQVILQATGDRVTIPITVTVGPSVFSQLAPIAFTKTYGGANPAAQAITVSSLGTNFNFYGSAATSTGGNWLTLTGGGCCSTTPHIVTLSANPATTLAPGVYGAEIILISQSGGQSMVVPVTLTVAGTSKVATPVFTPPGGSYGLAQSVVLTDSTPGSSIFYTTDGSTPTSSSTMYSVPITVSTSKTINAIAVAPGYVQSLTGTAKYIITTPPASTPMATQTIAIAEATAGATVYYTTNGTTPTTSSTKYTGPITLTASSVLKFIAVAPNFVQSAVRTVTTTIQ